MNTHLILLINLKKIHSISEGILKLQDLPNFTNIKDFTVQIHQNKTVYVMATLPVITRKEIKVQAMVTSQAITRKEIKVQKQQKQ